MKDFLKKYKISVAVASYVVLVLVFLYFSVMPSIVKISEKAQKIQQQEIDRKLHEERISSLPAMEDGYEKFKDNEAALYIVMDSSKEVDFIKELEILAEETSNKVEFRIEEKVDKKTAKKKDGEADIKGGLTYANYLPMQVALEGDYEGLLKFMHKLENFHNYVNIVSVSSEKKEVRETGGNPGLFSAGNQTKTTETSRDVLNTILDIVVYTSQKI